MVRTKVFVGNLDFKTQESELAQEFAAAGKVISANIITRGPRSLGYGFVELESEQDAQNAVKVMNKKKINDREINVEIARERVEGQPRPQRGPSKRLRYKYRKNFRGNNNNAERGNDSTDEPTNNAPRRRPFRRVRQDRGEQQQDHQQQQQQRPPRITRPPRRPIEERNHIPSKTTLFVANLPFVLDDESFGQVFKDEGLPFKSAHVVKKRNNRSKGFGFVEFDSESDQQKALNVINNKNVKGRELVVKIALTEQREREEVTNPPKEENKQEKPAEPKKEEKKPEPKKEEKKPADKDEKKPTEPKKNETKKSEPKKQENKK